MSNTNNQNQVGGIILCGGESLRMNYPKALLPLGQELMLQRVIRIVSEVVSPVIIVASRDQELPEIPDSIRVVYDVNPGAGPLPAIALGLRELALDCQAAFVSACDTPLIHKDIIQAILSKLAEHDLAMVREGQWYHPLAAVYRTSLVETIEEMLAARIQRPIDLAERVNSAFLDVEELRSIDPQLHGLRNINTREQYFELLRETGLEATTRVPFDR
ncbi:molybdenum cofactor guanylyltransferase [Gimesia maris]|uniref:molybdenum cofactor guanylyltransferase n=1 Tax=Gimesia maris TaxID=122 RepID=UPI00241C3111|nr:molybdenum cofactor guanylyltransferase [Gimesia maris]|tara:strand:- start:29939 stop:30589 length:651 start_codon:yes stop_codon:yes gene_type:complete